MVELKKKNENVTMWVLRVDCLRLSLEGGAVTVRDELRKMREELGI